MANRYSFSANNPVRYLDPDGLAPGNCVSFFLGICFNYRPQRLVVGDRLVRGGFDWRRGDTPLPDGVWQVDEIENYIQAANNHSIDNQAIYFNGVHKEVVVYGIHYSTGSTPGWTLELFIDPVSYGETHLRTDRRVSTEERTSQSSSSSDTDAASHEGGFGLSIDKGPNASITAKRNQSSTSAMQHGADSAVKVDVARSTDRDVFRVAGRLRLVLTERVKGGRTMTLATVNDAVVETFVQPQTW